MRWLRKYTSTRREEALLEEARESARAAKLQLDQARQRRAEVEEEIRLQRKMREEDGFGAILQAIFQEGKR